MLETGIVRISVVDSTPSPPLCPYEALFLWGSEQPLSLHGQVNFSFLSSPFFGVKAKRRPTSSFAVSSLSPSISEHVWRLKIKLCLSYPITKGIWKMSEHVKNTPLLYALLALKCLDGIWAENKHEESQNKWFLFSARSAWNQCILDQCNALLSDSQGASFHGDSPLRVPLRNALRMGECSSQNKGGVQGKHFLGSEIYMHGPIAESDSLNPHSGFSQRDVQFSLTQLQNIELFFVWKLFRISQIGVCSPCCHFYNPQASYLTFLILIYKICKMGMIVSWRVALRNTWYKLLEYLPHFLAFWWVHRF